MFTVYIVLLIVGAGLALLSLAGEAFGGGEMDAEALVGGSAAAGEGGGGWWEAFSLLSLVYAAFGAGLAGTVLHLIWGDDRPMLTGIVAAGTGLACGVLANATIVFLRRSGSGDAVGEASFEGLVGQVTLPIRDGVHGQIRVHRGSRSHVLRALPHGAHPEAATPAAWTRVVVVEVRDGVAYVTPVGPELDALPS
jgi:hypothetical protein